MPVSQAEERAGRERITCACGVNGLDGDCRNLGHVAATRDQRAVGAERHERERPAGPQSRSRGSRFRLAGQQQRLVLVSEHHVHIPTEDAREVVTMAVNAETIGQAQGDTYPESPRFSHGGDHGCLLIVRVPQVSGHVQHAALAEVPQNHVGRRQAAAFAEVGAHRPLFVRCDQHYADTRGAVPLPEVGPNSRIRERTHIGGAEVIAAHAAGEAGSASQGRNSDHSIGARSACGRIDDAVAYCAYDRGVLRLVYQVHGAPDKAQVVEDLRLNRGLKVEEGIAHTEHVEGH